MFSFIRSTSPQHQEHYYKREEKLTNEEKDLLLGELIVKWNNNIHSNRIAFILRILSNNLLTDIK